MYTAVSNDEGRQGRFRAAQRRRACGRKFRIHSRAQELIPRRNLRRKSARPERFSTSRDAIFVFSGSLRTDIDLGTISSNRNGWQRRPKSVPTSSQPARTTRIAGRAWKGLRRTAIPAPTTASRVMMWRTTTAARLGGRQAAVARTACSWTTSVSYIAPWFDYVQLDLDA